MPEPIYDTSAPVLVTGATGYVAGWLIRRLLEEGFTVHAAVRDPSNESKIAHLNRMAEEFPGSLRFFKADLLDEGSYDEAMKGCRTVFHTASPFTSAISDPQKDLVDPAVQGTRNVLSSADRTASVERVVLTSSCAAIYGDNADIADAPGEVLTEDVWNTSSTLDHQAYSFSKTEAEKAAWQMAEGKDWKLVVVNPSFVLGPGLSDAHSSESFSVVRQLGDGTMKTGAPPLEIGMVDVRDVAEAHMRAAFVPGAEGRHITSEGAHSLLELGQMLRARFGNAYPFPKGELPKWLLWLVGPMIDKNLSRGMVARNMGYEWRADNSKSKRELGLTYRPIDRAIGDMFERMLETGAIKRRG